MAGADTAPTPPPPANRRKGSSRTTTTTHSLVEDLPPAAMSGGRRRRHRRRRKDRRVPPVHKLSDDLVLEILLRLPSLATLVRAACACRAWRRAVASSPAFRRRFRSLHPPPLLGFFVGAPDTSEAPDVPYFPTFTPVRPRDGDLAAAVRGGDFFLTSLQVGAGESRCWDVVDCSRGSVLLQNWKDGIMVVMNPLIPRSKNTFEFRCGEIFPGCRGTAAEIFDGCRGTTAHLEARLLCSDEDSMSFRVVMLAHDTSRVRAAVFSSDTREWSFHPWVEVPYPVGTDGVSRWIENEARMEVNGSLFWIYKNQRHLISLDIATMKFSTTEMPQCPRYSSYAAGETKDGETCIIYSEQFNIGVLMHTRNDNGVEGWELGRVSPLDKELERVIPGRLDDIRRELLVLAVCDGYVYLAARMHGDPGAPC